MRNKWVVRRHTLRVRVSSGGHGFGSLPGGILITVAPLIKRGALVLGNRALKTGTQIAGDVLSGQNIRSAAKRRAKIAGNEFLHRVYSLHLPVNV